MAKYSAYILAAGVLSAMPAAADAFCQSQGAAGYQRPPDQGSDEHRRAHGDAPGDKRPPKWWVDEQSRAELGITSQQSAEIEQIFSATLPKLRGGRHELEQLEATLAQTIKDSVADPAVVRQQVEKVENLRAELNKTRTLMLYQMHRVLTAEQRQKLDAMFQRREREHKTDSPERR
jgi:Spy/CpxP family protein refolding chaperone